VISHPGDPEWDRPPATLKITGYGMAVIKNHQSSFINQTAQLKTSTSAHDDTSIDD